MKTIRIIYPPFLRCFLGFLLRLCIGHFQQQTLILCAQQTLILCANKSPSLHKHSNCQTVHGTNNSNFKQTLKLSTLIQCRVNLNTNKNIAGEAEENNKGGKKDIQLLQEKIENDQVLHRQHHPHPHQHRAQFLHHQHHPHPHHRHQHLIDKEELVEMIETNQPPRDT